MPTPRSCRSILALAALFSSPIAWAQTVPTEPYTWKSVVIKANGFIDGVVFSPVQKGLVYIHTDMGGAYRLDGDTWTCLTDWIQHDDWSLNQMGAETLAIDPTDPKRVYIGLGTYMGPSAVVRSEDQGRTWQRTNVPFGMNGNGSARQAGERMNVDPNQPSRLIYGSRTKGLWQSNDYAASWTQIESFPSQGDADGSTRDTGITWTLFDKSSASSGTPSANLYAGVMTLKMDRVFRSLDSGKTWSAIPGQPDDKLLPNRACLTSDGKTLYITFVVAGGYPGPHSLVGGSVYRVNDPASDKPTWTEIAPSKGTFAWSGLSLDPAHPDYVYITTLCRYGTPGDDIYRSTNRGQTWKPLNIAKHRDDSSAQYAKNSGIHWTGDVQVDPLNPDIAFFTTGYGLYRTANLTSDEPTWVFYNEGFEQSAALELVSPKGGSANLLSAIGDRDGYRHEDLDASPKYGQFGQVSDFGQKENRSMGTCQDIDVAWDKPEVVVRVGGPAQYSNDGGITWTPFKAPQAASSQPEGNGRRARGGASGGSISISKDGTNAVWAPARSAILHVTRTGDTWSDWKPASNIAAGGNVMVAADLANPSIFYLRSNTSLYTSTDAGATWQLQTDKLPDRAHWLRAIPGHEGHLVLTAGDEGKLGLHKSTDGGKTWTRLAPDLVTVAKQVGVGAPPPGKDYPALFIGGTVGNLRGFFRSDDAGASWIRVNDDAHNYGNVTVINGDSRVFGRLYVGTNGRGILYADPKK